MSIARAVQKHLEALRNKPMNRQARIVDSDVQWNQSRVVDSDAEWNDHGAVSLNDAAIAEAAKCLNDTGVDCVKVQVRECDGSPFSWTVAVEREITYRVRGLRGGE